MSRGFELIWGFVSERDKAAWLLLAASASYLPHCYLPILPTHPSALPSLPSSVCSHPPFLLLFRPCATFPPGGAKVAFLVGERVDPAPPGNGRPDPGFLVRARRPRAERWH